MRSAYVLVLTLLLVKANDVCVCQNVDAAARPVKPDLSTIDSSSWQVQLTGIPGVSPKAIAAVDQSVCWLGGIEGKIVRTVDGGNSWSLVNFISPLTINAFEALSDGIAFVSTATLEFGAVIQRTTDAGSTWMLVFSQPDGFITGIKIFTPTKGIAVGDPVGGRWTILRTSDGGLTWVRDSVNAPLQIGIEGGLQNGLGSLDSNYIWFTSSAGRVYATSNGGVTWSGSSGLPAGLFRVWFNTPAFGLAVGSNWVYRTTDGGMTWLPAANVPGTSLPGGLVGALGTSEFWVSKQVVYYTPDIGNSWTAAPPHGLNRRSGLIDMVTLGSALSAWATGIGDTVYHYTRTVTGVEEPRQTLPGEVWLGQNYPNPFNPTTNIGFKVQGSGFTLLRVYDVLGREVATLVNEVKTAGLYDVHWDARGITSGVYLCRLQAGSFTSTRKMILIR